MKTPPGEGLTFAEFQLPTTAPAAAQVLDRATFNGSPEESARRLVEFAASRTSMREVTKHQKQVVLTKVLRDFEQKGKQLATLSAEDVAVYREWLRSLVEKKAISESYAAHIATAWNAAMHACFGDEGKPGENNLKMRGFQMRARAVERLDENDIAAMLNAAHERRFKTEHHRDAFITYLEIARCAGPRVGSLLQNRARVKDVDWDKGMLRLRHMKNMDQPHSIVLDNQAMDQLRRWVEHLRMLPAWQGQETPLFIGPDGNPLSHHFINTALKGVAATAGIRKPVSSHVIRKSVGTHIARFNERLAREQLGITQEIFERHYNQPTEEDRLSRRDLLPGYKWNPKTPEEMLAAALADLAANRITRQEFEARCAKAEALKALPNARSVPETSAYA